KDIGDRIGKDPTTISKEVMRFSMIQIHSKVKTSEDKIFCAKTIRLIFCSPFFSHIQVVKQYK
ncbi:MAG: helix-turn-helix domain-containing protein, partial [Ruminococcus sp.]|nr:helix-turn-helix domain-containing protein [Ruminococcus sp.]